MQFVVALSAAMMAIAVLSSLATARAIRRTMLSASPTLRTHGGTEHLATEFISNGFVPVGSIDVCCDAHDMVVLCLLSPAGTSIAAVTPTHLQLVSTFKGRWLTTTNERARPSLPNEAVQHVVGSVAQLWSAHKDGIDMMGSQGSTPDVVRREDALDVSLTIAQRSVSEFSLVRELGALFGGARRTEPLRHDKRAQEHAGALLARFEPPSVNANVPQCESARTRRIGTESSVRS